MLKAQHTIADSDSVLKLIKKQYPNIGATDCRLLALGCNDNFRIKGKRQDYAFRLYRLDWWPEKEIDEELRFLEVLNRHKINVCKPIRNKNKKRYIKTSTPEGIRFGALFTFIPGRQLGFKSTPYNKNILQLGNVVADVHHVADNIKQPIQRWNMGFDNVVNEFLRQAPAVLGHRQKDLNYLQRLANQLEEVIFSQPDGALNIGLCHGDLHVHNVMLQPDGKITIFDFDWCAHTWRIYDLATVWWSLAHSNKPISAWHSFLRGYTQKRKLTKQEKTCLPWFVVYRHFEFLNFQLSMRKHIGSAWLSDNYYDHHIGFFKKWLKQLKGSEPF